MKIMKLIPAIIQEEKTKEVLMLGYMNTTALQKTRKSGRVWFWSRKRRKLWMKGESSGNTLEVKKIMSDCDKDTLLVLVKLTGSGVCHTGARTCFQYD
jgi:phosphoribosyl-AMP cyclohydrolase